MGGYFSLFFLWEIYEKINYYLNFENVTLELKIKYWFLRRYILTRFLY